MCVFPTDFLRTLSHTFSKSPQKFTERLFLPENQYTILLTHYVGFVVIVGLKPSKPTFPTHVVFIFRVSIFFEKSFRVPKNRLRLIVRALWAR